MRPSCSLDDLIPHRPPMRLIDAVEDFDEASGTLTTSFSVRPEWSGNWVSIEYMAQSAAALIGLLERRAGGSDAARPGFLLGTRRLTLEAPSFRIGARYRVRVALAFADEEAASFDCSIVDGDDRPVASAVLNAYRPKDLTAFLDSQGLK